jgi:hypothetical protein
MAIKPCVLTAIFSVLNSKYKTFQKTNRKERESQCSFDAANFSK